MRVAHGIARREASARGFGAWLLPASGAVQEKLDDRRSGLVDVGLLLRNRRENERADGAAEEAHERIPPQRLELPRGDTLLEDRTERGAKPLHATQRLAGRSRARGRGAGEETVLVGDRKEGAVL